MLAVVRSAVVLLLLCTGLTGIAYPLLVTGFAQLAMPNGANGSLVRKDGRIVGSTLIGQLFTSDRYLHGRPSSTTAPDPNDDAKTIDRPYNAGSSAGSNLGPLSKKLIGRVQEDVAMLRKLGATTIPADAVTASASGLDPHVSPAYAALQIERIARARNVPTERIRVILDRLTEPPTFGIIGEPRVNVLRFNLELDTALGGSNR